MEVKPLAAGVVLGLMLAACAGVSFPYRYYGIASATYSDGKLIGPLPTDDLSFQVCAPTTGHARPCIAMLTTEFLNMKKDYLDTKNQLIDCQKK